jgi:hypothetical protein
MTAAVASVLELGHTFGDSPHNFDQLHDELLVQISRYRQDKRLSCATDDEDYVLLYAYSKFPEKGFAQASSKPSGLLFTDKG